MYATERGRTDSSGLLWHIKKLPNHLGQAELASIVSVTLRPGAS